MVGIGVGVFVLTIPVGELVKVEVKVGRVPVKVVVVRAVIVAVGVEVGATIIGATGFLGAVLLSEQAKGKITLERTMAKAKNFFTFGCFFILCLDKNTELLKSPGAILPDFST